MLSATLLDVCMTLYGLFTRRADLALKMEHGSLDIWDALAVAGAHDLREAAALVAQLGTSASSEVSVRFPRGICAFIHEPMSAINVGEMNPHPEWARVADRFLRAATGQPQTPDAAHETPEQNDCFSGGNGDSFETAVVINTDIFLIGVQLEYAYVTSQCGERQKDWRMQSQSMHPHGESLYDVMTVDLSSGQSKTFFFDISKFYGK
jgi:hypothetical protein